VLLQGNQRVHGVSVCCGSVAVVPADLAAQITRAVWSDRVLPAAAAITCVAQAWSSGWLYVKNVAVLEVCALHVRTYSMACCHAQCAALLLQDWSTAT
jgi:hypothetical protein